MVKSCHKFIYRLVPVVAVFCILIGCVFALPASANSAGWNPSDPTSKLRPIVGAKGYFVFDVYPGDDVAVTTRLSDYTILGANERAVTTTFYAGSHEVAVTIHSRSEHTVVDGKDSFRQIEEFNFADTSGSEVVLENLAPSYIYLDSFGGRWNPNEINRLFWLATPCTFAFSCDFWFLADNGTVIRVPFSSEGNCTGLQSPLFFAKLTQIANNNNVVNGDPYLCTNGKLEITMSSILLEPLTKITINREATLFGSLQDDPLSDPDEALLQNDVAEFLINVGLNQPPPVNGGASSPPSSNVPGQGTIDVESLPGIGSVMSTFLANVVSTFSNTPVFGEFTFGNVFLLVLCLAVVFMIVRMIT